MDEKNIKEYGKELNKILDSFNDKISNLVNYKSHIESSTEKSFEDYTELNKSMQEHLKGNEHIVGFNTVGYFNIEDGNREFLEINTNTYEDMMKMISRYENKQYQWLLVDAYESFEDFLDEIYAYIGFIDNNFWTAKDFGSISINEIQKLNKEWFNKRIKEIGDRPNIIYKQLKKKISILNYYEKKNEFNIDLKFEITLISKIRHIIVHNGGIINDRNEFYNKILKEIGISNKEKDKYISGINNYIGTNNTYNRLEIILFKHPIKDHSGIPASIDRSDILISRLLSYAKLLTSLIIKYLDNTDFNALEKGVEMKRKHIEQMQTEQSAKIKK